MFWNLQLSPVRREVTPSTPNQNKPNSVFKPTRSKLNPRRYSKPFMASAPSSNETATLFVFEDDEAVIKMIIKARSPHMRHVSRTHRANEDWLCERINLDSSISIRFVSSNQQVENMITKVLARVTQETFCFFSVHGICVPCYDPSHCSPSTSDTSLPTSVTPITFTMSKKSWQDEASSAQKPEQVRAQL